LTFVVVTHDQEEAMTVADRIGVMNGGRLVQVATPSEIYEQPNSRWVADFIGDVNLIEGRVSSSGLGQTVIESVAGSQMLVNHHPDVAGGTHVWVALRPEKIRLETQRLPADDENCFAGTIVDIGYLGGLSVYKVKLDNGLSMKAAVANRTRLTDRPVGWNDRVWLCFKADAGLVLTR
jgi:putrescine transport system ATP-binding protein